MPVSKGRAPSRTWLKFARSFHAEFDDITAHIAGRLRLELDTVRDVDHDELVVIARKGMGALLEPVREHRPLDKAEFGVYAETTAAQAIHGVALDDMLHAWRIGLEELRRWGDTGGTRSPVSSDLALDFLDIVIPWTQGGAQISSEWYRRTAVRSIIHDADERRAFLRRLLSSPMDHATLLPTARLFGLSASLTYHAIRATGPESALATVRAWLHDGDAGLTRLVADIDGDVWGVVSRIPEAAPPLPVGVSAPASIAALPEAFRLATRALDTAVAMGAVGAFDPRALGIHLAIAQDVELGASLLDQYVAPVEELGASGGEILDTVLAYLHHQRHFERTAAELFVHPNTVRYRIRRYEELTGTTLRETATFVSVWWALERRRMRPKPGNPGGRE